MKPAIAYVRVSTGRQAQRQARLMMRQFARRELAPGAAERDRVPRFPREAFDKMAGLGMMGMVVPDQYGGAGLDYVSYALAIMEIAAADGAVSTAFQVHNSLVCLALLNYGNDDQKIATCVRWRPVNCWGHSA